MVISCLIYIQAFSDFLTNRKGPNFKMLHIWKVFITFLFFIQFLCVVLVFELIVFRASVSLLMDFPHL
jgi:hypothetical protein